MPKFQLNIDTNFRTSGGSKAASRSRSRNAAVLRLALAILSLLAATMLVRMQVFEPTSWLGKITQTAGFHTH